MVEFAWYWVVCAFAAGVTLGVVLTILLAPSPRTSVFGEWPYADAPEPPPSQDPQAAKKFRTMWGD